MVDNTLDIALEAAATASRIVSHAKQDINICKETKETALANALVYVSVDGPVTERRKTYNAVNIELSTRVNDIELGITIPGIRKYLKETKLRPIDIERDGVNITINPNGLQAILFLPIEGTRTAYNTEIRQNLTISISGQQPYIVEMRLRTTLMFRPDNTIETILLNHPRFLKGQQEYDPYQRLPVKMQQDARSEVLENIQKELQGNPISLEDMDFGATSIKINPVTSYIQGGTLGITSKYAAKRRYKRNLVGFISDRYDQRVSISKAIIREQITKIVSDNGGVLTDIEFRNGYLDIGTYTRVRKEILHITVITKVWIRYRINIFTRSNYLRYTADWLQYRYNIEAKRCWPVCNKVISKAEKITLRTINNSLKLTGNMGALHQIASRSTSRINKSGLYIDMNIRR